MHLPVSTASRLRTAEQRPLVPTTKRCHAEKHDGLGHGQAEAENTPLCEIDKLQRQRAGDAVASPLRDNDETQKPQLHFTAATAGPT